MVEIRTGGIQRVFQPLRPEYGRVFDKSWQVMTNRKLHFLYRM